MTKTVKIDPVIGSANGAIWVKGLDKLDLDELKNLLGVVKYNIFLRENPDDGDDDIDDVG